MKQRYLQMCEANKRLAAASKEANELATASKESNTPNIDDVQSEVNILTFKQ